MTRSKREIAWITTIVLLLSTMVFFAHADTKDLYAVNGEAWNSDISIMSFNVLDNTTNSSYDTPLNRARAIVSMINDESPDIIGVQEACQGCTENGYFNWVTFLQKNLADEYGCRVLTEENAVSTTVTHGLMIFYKKDRFEMTDSGAAAYTADTNRYYQWVELTDGNVGDTPVYFYNTHLTVSTSSNYATKQASSLTELRADMENRGAFAYPCFVVGDFNSRYSTSSLLCDFVDGIALTDGAITAGGASANTSLDHIFYNSTYTKVDGFKELASADYSPKLSDHNAIILYASSIAPAFLEASSPDGYTLYTYYQNGTFYINCMSTVQVNFQIDVEVDGGVLYTDADCTTEAGDSITAYSKAANTYRESNIYYLKAGNLVYPVDVRVCNAGTSSTAMYVDKAFEGRPDGEYLLYCDRWYCRKVTVGKNAFASFQDAIDAVGDGNVVYLAPGEYNEDVVINGKSVIIYGSNRNSIKALASGGNKYVLNSAKRTFESYLNGSITLLGSSGKDLSLMVNGIHFTGYTSAAQIRLLGGTEDDTVDLQIMHNVFDCYTNGAKSNGSVILATNKMKKVGTITDNYFNIAQKPTYVNDSGVATEFVNRAISMRNLNGITVDTNYFKGYTYALWLSSEVSDGSTVGGDCIVDVTNNLFESCGKTNILVNNITSSTSADINIAGNTFVSSSKIYINYAASSAQTKAGLTNVKANIVTTIKNSDKAYVSISNATGLTINYVS